MLSRAVTELTEQGRELHQESDAVASSLEVSISMCTGMHSDCMRGCPSYKSCSASPWCASSISPLEQLTLTDLWSILAMWRSCVTQFNMTAARMCGRALPEALGAGQAHTSCVGRGAHGSGLNSAQDDHGEEQTNLGLE